jgi:hypothetical protein
MLKLKLELRILSHEFMKLKYALLTTIVPAAGVCVLGMFQFHRVEFGIDGCRWPGPGIGSSDEVSGEEWAAVVESTGGKSGRCHFLVQNSFGWTPGLQTYIWGSLLRVTRKIDQMWLCR